MTKTRHIPQGLNLPELTRTFNRVWDAINQSDVARETATQQIQRSVSSLNTTVSTLFTAAYVTRYEVENDGTYIISDSEGHTRLVPYTLKVLA